MVLTIVITIKMAYFYRLYYVHSRQYGHTVGSLCSRLVWRVNLAFNPQLLISTIQLLISTIHCYKYLLTHKCINAIC
jgi:hypothetical protein